MKRRRTRFPARNAMTAAVLALAILLQSVPSHAYFNDSRSDWASWTPEQRFMFVQGVVDGAFFHNVSQPVLICIGNRGITARELVALVDLIYADPANWDVRPVAALFIGLWRRCGIT